MISLGKDLCLFYYLRRPLPPMCLFHIRENKRKQQWSDKNTPERTTAQLVQRHLRGLCQRGPSSFLPQSKTMHIRLTESKLPPGVSEWCVLSGVAATLSSLLPKSIRTSCKWESFISSFCLKEMSFFLQ